MNAITDKRNLLYRMLDKVSMKRDGEELDPDIKLGIMYRQFPKLAEEIFTMSTTDALAIFEKQIELVTIFKQQRLFSELEKKLGGDAA